MSPESDHRWREVTDIEAVPLTGDPLEAVKSTPEDFRMVLTTEVLICGGGFGGVAAAMAAAESGAQVCLLEETAWLGGQVTSQGVSALDEHSWMESFGGTKSYIRFREAIREHYKTKIRGAGEGDEIINPGKCWVSSLAFEPSVAVQVIDSLLEHYCSEGRLRIFRRTKVYGCRRIGADLKSVDAMNLESGAGIRFYPRCVIDASELSDLLPLAGVPYRVGAESRKETGEPHAPEVSVRECVQGCTYPFIFERSPAEVSPCLAPDGYRRFREKQPYSLQINIHGREDSWLQYAMFDRLAGTPGSVWDYRRLIAGGQFLEPRHDLSMINWPGNDYCFQSLLDLDASQLARTLQEAKRLSLGLAHWFQTEISDPERKTLRLRTDLLGTRDGLSKYPYIREARRIVPLETIREQDVGSDFHSGVRAKFHDDAIGVGHYSLDVHDTCDGAAGYFVGTKPFQIPLGALIPAGLENFIAGAKNIGVTHITNGCYRLHPVEWNVGEVAGHLAAFALKQKRTPSEIHSDRSLLRKFQFWCLSHGIPCSWLSDVPPSHANFFSIHALVILGGPPSEEDLAFHPNEIVTTDLACRWTSAVQAEYPDFTPPLPSVNRESFAQEVGCHLSRFL